MNVKTIFTTGAGKHFIIVLSALTVLITGCTGRPYLIKGEEINGSYLTAVVTRPIYTVPLTENQEFTGQVKKLGRTRALQLIINTYGSDKVSDQCLRNIIATETIESSECREEFCYWWIRYTLTPCFPQNHHD